jgi:hypothetical protein
MIVKIASTLWSSFWLLMIPAVVSALAGSSFALAEVSCAATTEAQAIDAAIAYHVDRSREQQQAISKGDCKVIGWKVGAPCINSEPYFSVEEFKAKNPNCCRIADPVPGDFSESLYPYIVGQKLPRIFLIEMSYNVHYLGSDGVVASRREHRYEAVDCNGKVMRGGFNPWP